MLESWWMIYQMCPVVIYLLRRHSRFDPIPVIQPYPNSHDLLVTVFNGVPLYIKPYRHVFFLPSSPIFEFRHTVWLYVLPSWISPHELWSQRLNISILRWSPGEVSPLSADLWNKNKIQLHSLWRTFRELLGLTRWKLTEPTAFASCLKMPGRVVMATRWRLRSSVLLVFFRRFIKHTFSLDCLHLPKIFSRLASARPRSFDFGATWKFFKECRSKSVSSNVLP